MATAHRYLREVEDDYLFVGQANACLIVEPPSLGAAQARHPAVDLASGERCQLLEDVDFSWEQLTTSLEEDGSAHLAPMRIA